jgi:hypothetical protein
MGLSKVLVAGLLRVGDLLGHPNLEILEHGCFCSRHRDRKRFASDGAEIDDIGDVRLPARRVCQRAEKSFGVDMHCHGGLPL